MVHKKNSLTVFEIFLEIGVTGKFSLTSLDNCTHDSQQLSSSPNSYTRVPTATLESQQLHSSPNSYTRVPATLASQQLHSSFCTTASGNSNKDDNKLLADSLGNPNNDDNNLLALT